MTVETRAMLHASSVSSSITGLTLDGDHWDCEEGAHDDHNTSNGTTGSSAAASSEECIVHGTFFEFLPNISRTYPWKLHARAEMQCQSRRVQHASPHWSRIHHPGRERSGRRVPYHCTAAAKESRRGEKGGDSCLCGEILWNWHHLGHCLCREC